MVLNIKLKGNETYNNIQVQVNILTSRTPRSKSFFSEIGHAAYQIKGNYAYNNMQANILHLYKHTGSHGMGSKGFFFQNMVIFQNLMYISN